MKEQDPAVFSTEQEEPRQPAVSPYMTEDMVNPGAGQLFLGEKLVWENPRELGHFGIRFRKQTAEGDIIEDVEKRWAALTPEEQTAKKQALYARFGIKSSEENGI